MSMKKIWLSLAAVASAALLVTGASFALFTATSNTANSNFTAGTVSFLNNDFTCTYEMGGNSYDGTHGGDPVMGIGKIAPGDKGSFECVVKYDGNIAAWLGLQTSLTGPLVACDATPANNLKFTIKDKDEGTTFVSHSPGTYQLVPPRTPNHAGIEPGDIRTIKVDWEFPKLAGNACQGKTATLAMTFHAVQVRNNTLADLSGPTSWN